MQILSGDECGVLKALASLSASLPPPAPLLPPSLQQSRSNAVHALAWSSDASSGGFGSPASPAASFLLGRAGPSVELWSLPPAPAAPSMSRRADLFSQGSPSPSDAAERDCILGLHSFGAHAYAFLDSGSLYRLPLAEPADASRAFELANGGEPLARRQQDAGRAKSLLGQTAATCCAFRSGDNGAAQGLDLAVGGKDKEVVLFSIGPDGGASQTWKAKNIAPHPQTLLQ
ncbi:hypothetical protein TeGR_g3861 [Tetraparma gracilis]|uniref:Uncharacterized protein n=1 Tax=Tetraparma gracilis TaxID=2962635 RepID=A0ABQ6MGS8_9STRA|nr:hypothetical protein TeGR_g3861 [Tetraparma gracilis]